MNLNQITLPTTDMATSISFYEALGLELIVHTHDRYARFVCRNGSTSLSLHLVEDVTKSGDIWIYFECDDLDHRVAHLISTGIAFDSMPTDMPWLWREARLKDPSGNQLILFFAGENRLNPPWRITTKS